MKKLLYVFSALALIFTSCSSDSDSSSDDSSGTVLVKKTIVTDADGNVVTTNFAYNGDKLVSIIDDTPDTPAEPNLRMFFTYTGNLITKIEYKLASGAIDQLDVFAYDANERLISLTRTFPNEPDWGNKETFVHNADGTISSSYYSGDAISQTNLVSTGKVFFTNGNISKIEEYVDGVTTKTNIYTYDAKNNPLKNILGMSKIAFTDGEAEAINNNMLTSDETSLGASSSVYTYNSGNYPITCVTTDADGEATTQFFYE